MPSAAAGQQFSPGCGKRSSNPSCHPHLLALSLTGLGVSHLNALFPHEGHTGVGGVVVVMVPHDGVHAGAGVVPWEEAFFLIVGVAEGESGGDEGSHFPCCLGLADSPQALAALSHVPPTCHPPVLQQQGTQHVGSVFCPDLVRDDHGLHHEVSDARQRGLLQVKEDSTCQQEGKSPVPSVQRSPPHAPSGDTAIPPVARSKALVGVQILSVEKCPESRCPMSSV